MANTDRSEVEVENLGGENRTLMYRTAEVLVLEKRLKMGAMEFIMGGGGSTDFLVEAIFAGMSRQSIAKKLNSIRIANWLDQWVGDRTKLISSILYAIARGKPAKEATEMCQFLDEVYGDSDPGKDDSPAG